MTQTILQWNCNGLKTHYCDLKLILVQQTPFCICLQESHLKPDEAFSLRGYVSFRKDVEPDQRARGGVAIFLKDNLSSNRIRLRTRLQAVAIQIDFPIRTTICNVYLPHFDWNIDDLNELAAQLPTPYIILGDFNAHNPIWGSSHLDPRGRLVEDFVYENGIILLNTGEGTFLNSRSNSFSAIDLTMCSPSLCPRTSWKILDDHLYSDHVPILIQISSNYELQSTGKRKWSLERANWALYKEKTEAFEIPININEAVEKFTKVVIESAEESIPMTRRLRSKPSVPWWTEEISEAVKEKKRALNIFRKAPSHENMLNFKRCRAKARRLIISSKKSSWEKYVATITKDTSTKEVWKKIKCIAGKRFPNQSPILQVDGRLISKVEEVAENLALHFKQASSSSSYNPNFLHLKEILEVQLDFSHNCDLPYNDPFNTAELELALQEAGNSAPGPDHIHYEMLRQLPEEVKLKLLNIYNKIWLEGTYPEQWREAIIIPIPKPNKDPKLPSSHRPISLICCPSKILEKMVNTRLTWHLERHQLLSNDQMGLRKGRSTTDALIRLENAIQKNYLERNHMVSIFFDLEKAYDTTWRHGILKKLHEWGIRGRMPVFIQSFLNHRYFRVSLGGITTNSHILENGVPQGSTLSVTLFAIAINDLVASIDTAVNRCLYVDDLVLFYSAKSMEDIENSLQAAIDKVVDEAELKGFRFSTEKTKCVHFCRKRQPHDHPQLNIKGVPIECKPTIKFLGLIFDSKLTWGPHIQDLATRCKKAINILRCMANINWGSDREILLSLYKSMILSRMDYGSAVYSSARISRLRVLESVHGMGIKLATGAFRTSPLIALCCDGGIPPLRFRRQQFLLSYAAGIWAQPTHSNYPILFEEAALEVYENHPTITRPAGVRLKEILAAHNEELPRVWSKGVSEVPPWRIITPNCRLECTTLGKREANKRLLQTTFSNILSEYPNFEVIYTDGSKTAQGVGSAISIANQTHSWTLHTSASIFTAELYAIWQALRLCDMEAHEKFLICSDSLSAIQVCTKTFSTDPLVQQVLALLSWLKSTGKTVIFIWTPSHVGILGNEMADRAARQAADNEDVDNEVTRPDDLKLSIKKWITNAWQREWDGAETKLKLTKPRTIPWKIPIRLSRREQVALTRLRIGHTHLTSVYLLTGGEQPRCNSCNTLLTVKHITIECTELTNIREQLRLPNNLKDILSNDSKAVKKIIDFIKRTGLIRKI